MASNTVNILIKADDQASEPIGNISGSMKRMGEVAAGVFAGGAILGGIEKLSGALQDSIAGWREHEKVAAQTEAVIASMGSAAGITASEVEEMANAFKKQSTLDDDVIQGGENILMTFMNIGREVFPRATQAAIDMSEALGQDMQSSAIQLGKALNDPIKGVTALQRVGVSFTASQKEQIKAMAEAGDVAGAQALILAELEKEFGGSAAAAQKAGGATEEYKDKMDDLSDTIGSNLLPIQDKFLGFLNDIMGAFLNLPDPVQKAVIIVAALAAGLSAVALVLPALVAGFGLLMTAAAALTGALTGTNLILAGIAVTAGVLYLAYQKLKGGSDDVARAAQVSADAQHLLATQTEENIRTTRDEIAALLDSKISQGAKKESIEATRQSLATYDEAIATINASHDTEKAKTDGVTTAAEALAGQIDDSTDATRRMDEVVQGINETLSTMTSEANAAFGALEKFRNVPTQEQLELSAAIAQVNADLANAKVRLDEAKASGDTVAQGIEESLIKALEGEKDRLDNAKGALDANREAAIAMGEAKAGASGHVAGLTGTEAELMGAVNNAASAMSGQMSIAQQLEYQLYQTAAAAETAAQAIAMANGQQAPAPGPYTAPFPGNAGGTDFWRGGWTWVGEQGPELINLPAGARVMSNADSMAMSKGGGGTTGGVGRNVTVNLQVQGSIHSERDLVRIIRNEFLNGGLHDVFNSLGLVPSST